MKRDIQLLIVDDNAATRYALRRRLENHHYQVLEAGTGQDGLDLIASRTIDALILDVNLPDMSGFDIVRGLRADPATALLPVVHVSAASIETGDIITGLDAGADAYLIHPVDPEVLLATLRTLLRVRDTEYALRESEARFREIFFNISAPIAVMDAQLKVHECNHAFAQLIHDNLNPDALLECFAADQLAVIQELCLRLAAGERWKGTLLMKVDDQLRETEWQISPYRRAGLSLVFVEDVTEHRHRERHQQAELANAASQLARTEAQLLQAQKMDALGKLTGGIAHDFNNLLTVILGNLEIVRKRMPDDPKLAQLLDNATQGALRGVSLTQRMLAFARRQKLSAESVELPVLVQGISGLLQSSMGPSIHIQTRFTEALSPVLADVNQLELAILNLATNARDAMPHGGSILIAADERLATEAGAQASLKPGRYVCLSITDEGEGMDEATLASAVEPFFTTKGVGKGTGLGLSMVHGLAEQLGGRLILESQKGVGTSAQLWLPLADSAASEKAVVEAQAAPTPPELLVLVVDDDSLVLTSTRLLIEDLGHRVLCAHSGSQALELHERNPDIDLVITDMAMPQMDGAQLAKLLRDRQPDLPIILATGYAERLEGFASQLPRLTKPFKQIDLVQVIGQAMN